MTQTLTKNKTLTNYVPGVTGRAGVPAKPRVPARVINELKSMRIEVPASAMEALFGAPDRITGEMVWTNYRTSRTTRSMYMTPFYKLKDYLRRPGLTEVQAHYYEVWALLDFSGVPAPMPVTWTSAWIEEERWVTTIIPAQPFVPAVPAVVGSPAIMTYDMHLGWNAGAHSAQVVEPGMNFDAEFSIGRSIGAAVGVARASTTVGKTRRSGYRHIASGVLMSEGRVRVIRDGRIVGSNINVLGDADVETFHCTFVAGTCQWSHDSVGVFATHVLEELPEEPIPSSGGGGNVSAPRPVEQRYALDAVLYAADDYVDDPSITLRGMADGTLEGVTKLLPLHVRGRMSSPSHAGVSLRHMDLRAGDVFADAVLRMPALSCIALADGVGSAALTLNPIRGVAGPSALGTADMRIAPMTLEADVDGDFWTPTYAIGATVLHPLVLGTVMLSGGVMDADLQLQPLWARLSETVHGEAVLGLEPMQVMGSIVTGTGPVDMVERVLPINDVTAQLYVTVVMAERLRGKDSVGLQLLAVASMFEQLEAGDSASVTQRALAFLLEQIGAMGPTRALTFRVDGDGWTLVDDSEGWAVNTETGGSSRYQGYGYDSFATVNGRHLGVRANGIYLLEGDTDAGQPIHAGVHLGLQDFGTSQLKQLSNVYLGVSATGGLFIKVGMGEEQYTYAARRVDPKLKTQRFDLGRGLRSNYFSFELVNDDGADFELEKIEFVAVASDRRI